MQNRNQFTIFGERCSETNIIANSFSSCTGLRLAYPAGFKHWPPPVISNEVVEELSPIVTLIIVRHPETWVQSLYTKPWHASERLKQLPFEDFIRAEWESVWNEDAYVYPEDVKYNTSMDEEKDPETGGNFQNLITMRKSKHTRFQEIFQLVAKARIIRLEDYTDNPAGIMINVAKSLDLIPKVKWSHSQAYKGSESWKRKLLRKTGFSKWMSAPESERRRPEISNDILDWLWDELDEKQESEFGYGRNGVVKNLR